MRKKLKLFSCIVALVVILSTNVFAADQLGQGLNHPLLDEVTKDDTTVSSKFDTTFDNVFGTVFFILKTLAVFGIVIEGVRYMYAGPQDKGKIKQNLLWITFGTVLVFGADIIIGLIVDGWNSI